MTFEKFKHDLAEQFGRISIRETMMLRRAYDAGMGQYPNDFQVLEKNYDDLYERTRWHFPAKGEYPENVKLSEWEDYNPLVLVFMYRYDDHGKAAKVYGLDRWEPESERWQYFRLDKIVAWQYLPEEPKEETNDSKEVN